MPSKKSSKVKVVVYAHTNRVGSRNEVVVEFDREEWEDMSDEEKEEAMREEMFELIEWGWHEEDSE